MITVKSGCAGCRDRSRIHRFVWPQCVLLAALVLVVTGCGSDQAPLTSQTSNYEVADGDAELTPTSDASRARQSVGALDSSVSTETAPRTAVTRNPVGGERQAVPPERPSSRPPPTVNPSAPAGEGPEEQLAFIAELQSRQPVGVTRESAMLDFQQTQQQIISVAEKLLNSGATQGVLVTAGQAKIQALDRLSQMGVEGASELLLKFCDELDRTGDSGLQDLAGQGRDKDFMVRVNAFAVGQITDPQPLLVHLREMLNRPDKDPELLTLGGNIAALLEDREFPAEAQQVYRDTAAAFAESREPQVVDGVAMLREEAELAASGIRQKYAAALQRQTGAGEEFLAAARQLLANENRGEFTKRYLLEAAYTFETNQFAELAGQLFAAIGPAFDDHPDRELADEVRQKVDNYARRASLVGRPITVEGVGLDGAPLDWSRYRGKVVLVDFWATWCRPCLDEIPNIKNNYEQYRDQGFEVVGVNLDDDTSRVESFFSLQSLPWPTVVSADPESRGMQTPLAVRCGVEFIPFIVLVGRDGRVAALNVRGGQLGPKLAELLAQPATGG